MSNRIQLPARIGGYAVIQAGESPLEAVSRSIARRLGGGATLHSARECSRQVTNSGKVLSREYQLTFVYPEIRRGGGFPVAGEFHMTFGE